MKHLTSLFALLFSALFASAQMPHRDPSGLIREVKIYTSGTQTWTKPAGLVYVEVYALGGGGGGGSGRRGAADTNRSGGGGGNGGNYHHGVFQGVQLAGTYSVTAGAGGIGGPVQTVNNTNGNPGFSGGDSSFGNLVIAKGGNGGGGGINGTNINTLPPNNIDSHPSSSITAKFGGRGGSGVTVFISASTYGFPATGPADVKTSSGGGGGTGISLTNATTPQQTNAGQGGVVYVSQYANQNWNQVAYQAVGTAQNQGAAGANGIAPPATNVLTQGVSLFFGTGGAGGGFGNTAGTVAGGFGGNGGPGAGGGGGGASTNGAVSGKGGNGGNGWVIVVEYIQP